MVASLVLRAATIVFAALAVFSTTVLAVQMLFDLDDGSMPSKLAWVPCATILLGVATATLVTRMFLT